MTASENQPDWNKIAEKFDIWLPQLKPVGDALIKTLAAQPGDHIIDLGSGTGEPALSLARQFSGNIQITGIDSAEGMVKVAQQKAAKESLHGIEFRVMSAENLEFSDNTFDRALCRFGVMLFENPLKGLREIYRVLKPGGQIAFAVWGTPETMLTLYWTYQVFKDRIDEQYHPPLEKVTSLGTTKLVNDVTVKAGFLNPLIEAITFEYQFESFDRYWDAIEASDILKMQFDALPDDQRDSVHDEVRHFACEFIKNGRLHIPHEYMLVSATK